MFVLVFRTIFFGFFCILTQLTEAASDLHHYGWLESVHLLPYKAKLIAKFDTGAKTSSVNAANIRYYEKEGKTWVEFQVPVKGHSRKLSFKKKVEGRSRIKIKDGVVSNKGTHFIERPLVNMDICIGAERHRIQMNLADRHSFRYTMIIGRESIRQMHSTINPNKKFTRSLSCLEK